MKQSTRLLAGLALAVVAGSAWAQERYSGYLCCNMRTDGNWITDINYAEAGKTLLPAGTPVTITGYGRNRVRVDINGSRQAIGNDYSRDLALPAFTQRYVVRNNPAEQLGSWPAKVQEAVRAAKVTPGMTRDQVAMSLGWPVSSENPDLDAEIWRFWADSFNEFNVHFDAAGRVSEITATPTLKNRIWLP